MKLVFFIVIAFLLVISCDNSNDENILFNLSKISYPIVDKDSFGMVAYPFIEIFSKTENGLISQLSISQSYNIYKFYYSDKYNNYNKFLNDVIYQKIAIPVHFLNKRNNCNYIFQVDSIINSQYRTKGIEYLKKNWCEKNKEKLVIKSNVSKSKQYSVLYFLFLNNYFGEFYDREGYINIRYYKEIKYFDNLIPLF